MLLKCGKLLNTSTSFSSFSVYEHIWNYRTQDVIKQVPLYYIKFKLWVCMFAYSSRTNKPVCLIFGVLIFWNRKDSRKVKTPEIVSRSSPTEGGLCSSETKRDRKMAPGSELFVSARRLRERRPQPRKTCPGFESRWSCFLNWAQWGNSAKTRVVYFGGKIILIRTTALKAITPKNCPRFESWWDCLCGSETSEINNDAYTRIVCFCCVITGTYVTNPKTVLGLSPSEDVEFRGNNFLLWSSAVRVEWSASDKLSDNKYW
jgi:hypothetical protein